MVALPLFAHADEVDIPFGIWPQEFIEEAKEHGLNLEGGRGSDGHVDDKGMRAVICTYAPLDPATLTLITKLSFKHIRNQDRTNYNAPKRLQEKYRKIRREQNG